MKIKTIWAICLSATMVIGVLSLCLIWGFAKELTETPLVESDELLTMSDSNLTDVCDYLFSSDRAIKVNDLINGREATVLNREVVYWNYYVESDFPTFQDYEFWEKQLCLVNSNSFSNLFCSEHWKDGTLCLKTEFEIENEKYICYSTVESVDTDEESLNENGVVFRLEDRTRGTVSYDRDRFPQETD